jgi:hypothetical protein
MWLGAPLDGEPMLGERGWIAEYRLAVQDGRVIVAEVRVCPARWAKWTGDDAPDSGASKGMLADDVPRGGLSTRLLRRVPVGTHIDQMGHIYELLSLAGPQFIPAAMRSAKVGTWPGTGPRPNVEDVARRFARRPGLEVRVAEQHADPERKRAGRRPLADEVIVEAAAAYVETRKRGSAHPIPDTARALKMSEARLRDLVYRARRRGFLTPTAQGRGGGVLTTEARSLLSKVRRRAHRGRR